MISTARLVLRPPEARDVEAYIAFKRTPRAEMAGGIKPRVEAWRSFAALVGHWTLRGFGLFVADRNGVAIGMVGPWRPEGWPENELGWSIWDAALEGQGYAFEAAAAARDWARTTLGWQRPVSYIDHGNPRSIALAERLGAVRDPEAAVPAGHDCGVWRHP